MVLGRPWVLLWVPVWVLSAGCEDSSGGSVTAARVVESPSATSAAKPPSSGTAAAVRSDADCRQARACVDFGACTFRDGRCVATRDEDCKAAAFCERAGRCKAHEGVCVIGAATDAACRRGHGRAERNPCRREGRCTAEDGVCVARTDEDCEKSEVCAQFAACSAKDGTCQLLGEEDCKRSAVCRTGGRCVFEEVRGQALCVKPDETDEEDHSGHQH